MKITTPVPRDVWGQVVAASPASLAEHDPRWNDAICRTGPWSDASRLYEMDDGRRFLLPLVRHRAPGGWYASPPHAWGFGGIVGPDLDEHVVSAVVADLRSLRATRISIRPDPLEAPHWGRVRGAGITMVPGFAHVLDLRGGMDAVYDRFNKSTRRGMRRAEKEGVVVELDRTGERLDVHYDLYLRAVKHWAGEQREPLALATWRARRRDPIEKLRAMARHLGKDFCQFIAHHDGRPVASSIMLMGSAAHDTRAAMDREAAGPVRANDLLQWESIRHAVEQGCEWYHLGESTEGSSLAAFKERFGAVGHRYSTVRIERLPVTRVDTAARSAIKRVIGFKDA